MGVPNPIYGQKIKQIQEKHERGEHLDYFEARMLSRHKAGKEQFSKKRELINQDRADRIAEMEVLQQKKNKDIAAELGLSNAESIENFKKKHPNLMMRAYEKVEKVVEQQRVARALELSSRMSGMVEDAIQVFQDHLSGVKEGDLNPVVRQRAAEKVFEIVAPPKAQQKQVVHSFDPKALALIGNRQAALRAKNDIVTTAEVVGGDAEAQGQ